MIYAIITFTIRKINILINIIFNDIYLFNVADTRTYIIKDRIYIFLIGTVQISVLNSDLFRFIVYIVYTIYTPTYIICCKTL